MHVLNVLLEEDKALHREGFELDCHKILQLRKLACCAPQYTIHRRHKNIATALIILNSHDNHGDNQDGHGVSHRVGRPLRVVVFDFESSSSRVVVKSSSIE